MKLLPFKKIERSADHSLLKATGIQVKKDFSFEGLSIDVEDLTSFKELYKKLREMVVEVIRNDEKALYRLLYRIDIPDRLIQERMAEGHRDADAILAELIIAREYQKVKIRKEFSSGGESNEDAS